MIGLLCELNDLTREARHSGASALDPRVIEDCHTRYEAILAAGEAANPAPGGHKARSTAVRLLFRLRKYTADVLRFVHDLRVPFDNNLVERDIRMVKLRQKISGGLRTWDGARIFCAIRSYLTTARKHGITALEALTQLHNGHAWLPEPS